MIEAFDISSIKTFGLLFFFCSRNAYLVHIFLGVGLGWIFGRIIKSPRDIRRLMMAAIGFQDTTAIPLIFASVLGNDSATDKDKNFTKDAVSYVLIFTVFITVYKWSVAYG